ncbi:unnamed protein product [Microthlaspi erraticum]|uniref:Uncharacterized protein n=1 Tax=Microthlaspi erraticum TaxID=1685480 RepID=A0A6D2JY89_9BRAS|nr:unnamed protein product [Microthlaspi erraticum]
MAIESKILADAELAAMQEKLQMEEEKNKELAALAEENEKLREQNLVIESKLIAEAQLAEEESRLKEQQRNEPKKKGMVYARNLFIAGSNESEHWSWVALEYDEISSNALVEAAELLTIWWFEVNGTFHTRELTPLTHYEVMYVIKLRKSASGWDVPVNMKLVLPTYTQERTVNLNEHVGKGWVTIMAGEFVTLPECVGEFKFSMYENKGFCRKGLIVKGVAIRPKK